MANQKEYKIVINGIEKSITDIGDLVKQIDVLEKSIAEISAKGIKIPIDIKGDTEALLKELEKIKAKANKMPDIQISDDKEVNKVIAARKKAINEVEKEYKELNGTIAQYKKETKDIVNSIVKTDNETKKYTNTLNGLKAELKDLNAYKGELDLGSEEFAAVSQRILEINERLKQLEASQGTFGRNVGNYANSIKEALDDSGNEVDAFAKKIAIIDAKLEKLKGKKLNIESIKEADISIDELKDSLTYYERALDKVSIGSKAYDDINRKVITLRDTYNNVQKTLQKVVHADDQLKVRIQKNIAGQTYVWDNVSQAIGELEDKLYKLASEGQRNTKQFKEFADAAAELKVQLRSVDTEIDYMVEGGKGLNSMVSYFQGFTALATAGTGISQLFGGDDENAQKQMQTMTALLGVMESMRLIGDEMSKKTAFGKFFSSLNDSINKLMTSIGLLNVNTLAMNDNFSKSLETLGNANKDINELAKSFDTLNDSEKAQFMDLFNSKLDVAITAMPNLTKGFKELNKEVVAAGGKSSNSIAELYANIVELRGTLSRMGKGNESTEFLIKWQDYIKSANDAIAQNEINLKNSGRSIKQYSRVAIGALTNLLSKIIPVGRASVAGANQMTNFSKSMKYAAIGANTLNVAAKALRATLKAFLIFELINALMTVVELLGDLVKWVGKVVFGNDKLVNSFDSVSHSIDNTNDNLDKYNKLLDKVEQKGTFDSVQIAQFRFKKLAEETKKATKELQNFLALKAKDTSFLGLIDSDVKPKKLEDNLQSGDLTRWADIENIQKFKKEYEDLKKAVEGGIDIKKAQGNSWWSEFWYTASDAKSDLGEMQKRVIQDIEYRINNLDLSKGTDELKKFFDTIDEEMYATSLANIENLYPEEEWAKIFKARLEQVRKFYDSMVDANDDAAAKMAQSWKEEYARQAEREKTIRDNNIQAIKDDFERQMKELKAQRRDAVDAAKGDLEVIASINAKYNRLELDAIEAHNKELERLRKEKADKEKEDAEKLRDALKKIRDMMLESEAESLDKRIQKLKNQRDDEIEEAKENGVLVNELRLEIEIKYDKLIYEERKKYYQNLIDVAEDYAKKQKDLDLSIRESELKDKSAKIDIEYGITTGTSEGSFDFNAIYGDKIKAEKEFNQTRLQMELDFIEKKAEIDKSDTKLTYDSDIENEKRRYKESLKALKEARENGLATDEEYNSQIQMENEYHANILLDIENRKNSNLENINKQALIERKDTISESLLDEVNLYHKYADDVSDILSGVGRKTNGLGIINYSATKKDLDAAKNLVKLGLDDIKNERDNLDKKLKSGDITFIDYKDAQQQLDETEKVLHSEGDEIKETMDGILQDVIEGWANVIGSQFAQIQQTFSMFANMQYENEMNRIDKEKEILEKELEMLEEQFQKQEELYQEHSDHIQGIEDELSTARGDRRTFLLSKLDEEMKKREEAFNQEQKIERQKKINDKKKKMLEQQAEAAEKKKKKREKAAAIAESIMNTAMAVTMALATKPFLPLGLAMAALASTIGIAQTAIIAKTKFGNGGLLQGKSHAQGGIPVGNSGIEVEGNEYVINKQTTQANLPVIEMINSKKRKLNVNDFIEFYDKPNKIQTPNNYSGKFENGGILPNVNFNPKDITLPQQTDTRPIFVSVQEIERVSSHLRNVKAISGLDDND